MPVIEEHLKYAKMCLHAQNEIDINKGSNTDNTKQLSLKLNLEGWQKMSGGAIYEHDNIRLYYDDKNIKIAIVLNFEFNLDSDTNSKPTKWHTGRDVAKTLSDSGSNIEYNFTKVDDFVRKLRLLHCYRVFTYVLYALLTNSFEYYGLFNPALVILGFRENGSIAEMIALRHNIEAVTFESCGTPVRFGSNQDNKDTTTKITRYTFCPNLTNTLFPIYSGIHCRTYYLKENDPTDLRGILTKERRTGGRFGGELAKHGAIYALDHYSAHKAVIYFTTLYKLKDRSSAALLMLFSALLIVSINQVEHIHPRIFGSRGEIGKILGELIKRTRGATLEALVLTLEAEENPRLVAEWPTQLECMNIEHRGDLNELVNLDQTTVANSASTSTTRSWFG